MERIKTDFDDYVQQREEAAAEDDHARFGTIDSLVPGCTFVVACVRHDHNGVERLQGQAYWMEDARVDRNVEAGLIAKAGREAFDYFTPEGRILGAEDLDGVQPFNHDSTEPGRLRILSGVGFDPGCAAHRLHTAVNEHTKHAMAFARWGNTNPACDYRQLDSVQDLGKIRDAFVQADVLHCHVSYLLVNNIGIRPRPNQLLVRHYHGSKPKGTHIDADLDRARQVKLLGARLQLCAEARSLGLDMEWSPIPMPVARYGALAVRARAEYGWTPLDGPATPERPLRVVHKPTAMSIKGTDVLRRAVRALELAGVPIVLDLVHGVPLRASLERTALADVCFDSFWLGIQGSGLEAGAMGLPVIAGDVDALNLARAETGLVPYTFADDEQSLARALERMAMDPYYRDKQARMVHQYVSQHHDYFRVARRYESTLATWLFRADVLSGKLAVAADTPSPE